MRALFLLLVCLVLVGCAKETYTVAQSITRTAATGTSVEQLTFLVEGKKTTVLAGAGAPLLRESLTIPSGEGYSVSATVHCTEQTSETVTIVSCTERKQLAYYARTERSADETSVLVWHAEGTWQPPLADCAVNNVVCPVHAAARTYDATQVFS